MGLLNVKTTEKQYHPKNEGMLSPQSGSKKRKRD